MNLLQYRIALACGTINRVQKKRIGENGHACLVPQQSVKFCEVILLLITLAVGVHYKTLIN